ncbi:hypothetical protein FKM82_019758, partial [Ascaphus truei]
PALASKSQLTCTPASSSFNQAKSSGFNPFADLDNLSSSLQGSSSQFRSNETSTQKGLNCRQARKPQSSGTPWQSQSKTGIQLKPNYTVNFSVIGEREERGIRAPHFRKFLSIHHVYIKMALYT